MRQPAFLTNRDLILALTLGIGTGLIYLAFLPPAILSLDGNANLFVAESLVMKRDFTVPPDSGIIGAGGKYYSLWYPLLSILAVPFVAIGLAAGHLFSMPGHYVPAVFALVLPALLTAGSNALLALLSLHLGSTKKGACLAAFSFGFSTIAVTHARTFYPEPLLTFLTVACLCLAFQGTSRAIIGTGLLAGLCVLAKPTGVIVGPILSAYLFMKRRPIHVASVPLIGTTMGGLLYLAYNYMRFGDPLSSGFPWMFRVSLFLEGFLVQLFSPGLGLVFYCPPVIVSVVGFCVAVRRKAFEALAILSIFFAYLLLYSFWDGFRPSAVASGYTWAWGPRYLLPGLPGLMALTGLAERQWRKGLVFLTVLGFIGNAPTLVSFYERYYTESNEQGVPWQALIWSPAHSPLVNGWGTAYRQISDALGSDVKELVREAGPPAHTVSSSQALRVVAVWWWMLPAVGIPRWIGAMSAWFLIALGAWVLQKGFATGNNTRDFHA